MKNKLKGASLSIIGAAILIFGLDFTSESHSVNFKDVIYIIIGLAIILRGCIIIDRDV